MAKRTEPHTPSVDEILKTTINERVSKELAVSENRIRAKAEASIVSKYVADEIKKLLNAHKVHLVYYVNYNSVKIVPNDFSVVATGGQNEPEGTVTLDMLQDFEPLPVRCTYRDNDDKVVKYPKLKTISRR